MTLALAYCPTPDDDIDPNWDLVVDIIDYNPYNRNAQDEVIYRDRERREHRTSTRYLRFVDIPDVDTNEFSDGGPISGQSTDRNDEEH